ncbi:MAG TPA: hypothetical protein PJ991_06980 [Kiritimatiellia bacterium]|nr:hypothetical protein [Kiritimatiellia bacterium]
MKQRRLTPGICFALAVLFLIPIQTTFSQAPGAGRSPITVRKMDGSKASTPVFAVRGSSAQSSRTKDWFRIYVEYDSEPDWIDELNFTFYVLVRGKTRDAPPMTLFKGEVSYIHIASGRRHQADMFIHPNIINRFGDVERVAVEIRQGGRLLERSGKPTPTEAWWERLSPVDGVLLDRSQTPFALIDIDDYEIIKRR